jgi:hypothetical protein
MPPKATTRQGQEDPICAVCGLPELDPAAAPNGGYFSPSSQVIRMSVFSRSPSESADVTGVAPEKSLGPYSP